MALEMSTAISAVVAPKGEPYPFNLLYAKVKWCRNDCAIIRVLGRRGPHRHNVPGSKWLQEMFSCAPAGVSCYVDSEWKIVITQFSEECENNKVEVLPISHVLLKILLQKKMAVHSTKVSLYCFFLYGCLHNRFYWLYLFKNSEFDYLGTTISIPKQFFIY